MLFRQLMDYQSHTYTYLIASGIGREAVIIDPVFEQLPLYLTLLTQLNLKLVIAIDTHTHADHVTATGPLMQKLHCQIAMGEQSSMDCVSITVKDGEILNMDGIKLQALYTPGHTVDSYSYLMSDRVFTGDTLLVRSTGRTDFVSGSPQQQYDSLFHKLLKLPAETLVYPAHDYNGSTCSTIWEEKLYNPRLQVNELEEYVHLMNNLNLAKPKMFDIAIAQNQHCGLCYQGEKANE